MKGVLAQLNVSKGGMPKLPVGRVRVTRGGVDGDKQRNLKYHGGEDRAVCIFSVELYDWLRTRGIDLKNGSAGENFTTSGVDLQKLKIGDRLRVGKCTVQITNVRIPCSQLKKWDADLPELVVGRSGWVASVVEEGDVQAGDSIDVLGTEGTMP